MVNTYMPLAADPQNPLLAVPVMAGVALVVAFVTFKWLSSSGRAKTQYGEVGGAAAGFIVTFGVLADSYYALEPRWADTRHLKQQVAQQKRVIESSRLPEGFVVPASYTPVLDRPHGIAFGYPSRWQHDVQRKLGVALNSSLVVEHRLGRPAHGVLQFVTEPFVAPRAMLISLTFSGTLGERAKLNDVRERVINTLKFLPPQT
jgi:hypothetical protein